jgi:putative transposase
MPDHLHFFAWPGQLYADIDNWVQFWKSMFTKRLRKPDWRWQRASFHHRIRSHESAEERRADMFENPVRAGLVQKASDSPYAGELFKPDFWW